MVDIIIVGAGSAAREILSIIQDINKKEDRWNIIGFIADYGQNIEKYTKGRYKIIGTINEWIPKANEFFTVAIADPKGREFVVNKLREKRAKFVNIIHPTVRINDYCKMGKGIILYPYASVGNNAKIGDFTFIQGSNIAHDVRIGEFTTVSGLCGILGNVYIGKRVFVGSHSVIIPDKAVGDDSYIGAGSVVIKNVKSGTKVFGNPAKVVDF